MDQIKIDRKSKILFVIFFIFLAVSIFFTYKKYIADKNFEIIESETTIEN